MVNGILPKVSVVTVCYNAVDCIEETMLSILNQDYENLEYIIIDGGSKDGTVSKIKKIADDPIRGKKIKYWISEPDKGIYDAMNKGIEKATGEYINFMNAGDSFVNNETVRKFMNQLPKDIDIAYGDTIFKAPAGEYRRKTLPISEITHCMPFGHQSTFVLMSLMKNIKFDTSFRSSGDYNFFYSCYKKGIKFGHIKLDVAKYENGYGMSVDNYRVVLKENARITGNINKIKWRIQYYIIIIEKDIKRIIKKFIPTKLLLYRQKKIISSRFSS